MATIITESIIVTSEHEEKVEIFINTNREIVLQQIESDLIDPFFFVLNNKDWNEIKKFIDAQLQHK